MRYPTLLTGLILLALASEPAFAMEQLDDSQLADIRGGFGGSDGSYFNFSAQMTTTINGQLVLSTTLTANPQGSTTTSTVGAGAMSLSQASKYGLNVAALPQNGVFVPGSGGGGTAIIQNTSGQIMNVVINNASNQGIVQNTSISLIVPNLAQLKQEATLNTLGATVSNAINAALVQMNGH